MLQSKIEVHRRVSVVKEPLSSSYTNCQAFELFNSVCVITPDNAVQNRKVWWKHSDRVNVSARLLIAFISTTSLFFSRRHLTMYCAG
jgi:hypothetical protein